MIVREQHPKIPELQYRYDVYQGDKHWFTGWNRTYKEARDSINRFEKHVKASGKTKWSQFMLGKGAKV